MKNRGIVINIQKYSLHDGDGIRTLVFLKGCPLGCLWCANPESQNMHREIALYPINCIECGECVNVCKSQTIGTDDETGSIKIDRSLCDDCGECAESCYSGGIKLIGECMTVEEVFSHIKKDITFYKKSNGGVTLSGGEPTVQPEFCREILKKCKENGISTAIETCGYTNWEALKDILQYADVVLYDLKVMDEQLHIKYTGVSNSLIKENAGKIARLGKEIIIRYPMIPGYNTSEDNIKNMGEFARSLNIKRVDILPYHQLGVSKYSAIGKVYQIPDINPPTEDEIEKARIILESCGCIVHIGG